MLMGVIRVSGIGSSNSVLAGDGGSVYSGLDNVLSAGLTTLEPTELDLELVLETDGRACPVSMDSLGLAPVRVFHLFEKEGNLLPTLEALRGADESPGRTFFSGSRTCELMSSVSAAKSLGECEAASAKEVVDTVRAGLARSKSLTITRQQSRKHRSHFFLEEVRTVVKVIVSIAHLKILLGLMSFLFHFC